MNYHEIMYNLCTAIYSHNIKRTASCQSFFAAVHKFITRSFARFLPCISHNAIGQGQKKILS